MKGITKTFEAFNKDTYQYKSVAFEIKSEEDLRKVVTFFHNLKVEGYTELDYLVNDLISYWNRGSDMLLVDFRNSFFYIMHLHELSNCVINEGTNPKLFVVSDLHLFDDVPNYSPKKITRSLNEGKDDKEPLTIICKITNRDEAFDIKRKLEQIDGIKVQYNNLLNELTLFPNWLFIELNWSSRDSIYINYWSNTNTYDDSVDDINRQLTRSDHTDRHMYKHDELDHLLKKVRSHFGIMEVPSYRPRRIERTLESVTHKFPYKEIGMKVESRNELIKIEQSLGKIGLVSRGLSYDVQSYPNYIFIDVWQYENYKKIVLCYLSNDSDIESSYHDLVAGDPMVYQHMFGLSEIQKVENILKYGMENAIPNYNPKRIERTLEDNGYFMYDRAVFEVNNEDENEKAQEALFKLGYGWSLNSKKITYFTSFPHYLFTSSLKDGEKKLTHMYFEYFERDTNNIGIYISKKNKEDGSNICPTVFKYKDVPHLGTILKHGRSGPSYIPRKSERTLESVENIPHKVMVFVIRNEQENKMVQDVLIKKGYSWNEYDSEYKPFRCYPQTIWVYLTKYHLSSSSYGNGDYSDERVNNYIKMENRIGTDFNPILFKATDVKFFDVIKKTGRILPNYEPRKNNREI